MRNRKTWKSADDLLEFKSSSPDMVSVLDYEDEDDVDIEEDDDDDIYDRDLTDLFNRG